MWIRASSLCHTDTRSLTRHYFLFLFHAVLLSVCGCVVFIFDFLQLLDECERINDLRLCFSLFCSFYFFSTILNFANARKFTKITHRFVFRCELLLRDQFRFIQPLSGAAQRTNTKNKHWNGFIIVIHIQYNRKWAREERQRIVKCVYFWLCLCLFHFFVVSFIIHFVLQLQ